MLKQNRSIHNQLTLLSANTSRLYRLLAGRRINEVTLSSINKIEPNEVSRLSPIIICIDIAATIAKNTPTWAQSFN